MNRFGLVTAAASILVCSAFHPATPEGPEVETAAAGIQVAVYPRTVEPQPGMPSPFRTPAGEELVLMELADGKLAYAPVTVENGEPYSCACGWDGKGMQLRVSEQFPTLRATGLHDEGELDNANGITGYPYSMIDCIARPKAFSYNGFMAEDESILAVLKGDNRLVRALGLKHPQLATPLFHLWNLMRLKFPAACMIYNGQRVRFSGEPTKSYQESIFRDEVQGTWDISVRRDLNPQERSFLAGRFPALDDIARADLEARLSRLRIGEMSPFYIMRYGFYEGHTMWRSDPIAISFIFGLRRIEELANAFGEDLYKRLTNHYSREGIAK